MTPDDACHTDKDGYVWFIDRADNVVRVDGNWIGTAEHEVVVVAAVMGKPHQTAGEQIKAFVILKQSQQESPNLSKQLQDHVSQEWGKIAVPREIEIVPSLPKTRSGKIMHRVLKAKELGQDPGNNSTLEESILSPGSFKINHQKC